MSLGSELKEAREARGISLADITKKTRIPEKYLEAIERDDFSVFPSQTYAKGFIRAIAKVVGSDPAVLTRQFNAENQKQEMKIEPKNAEADLERTLSWRATLSRPPVFRRQDTPGDLNLEIVEEAGYADTTQPEPASVRKRSFGYRKVRWGKWAPKALALSALVLVLAAAVHYGRGWHPNFHWGQSKNASAQGEGAASQSPPVADKYQHLVLKALDKSWVLVKMDDGQSSSESELEQGEVKAYQASKNFTVKLGNAGGVDVQFNGRSLGVLGTAGEVVEIQLPQDAGDGGDKEADKH